MKGVSSVMRAPGLQLARPAYAAFFCVRETASARPASYFLAVTDLRPQSVAVVF
jgi:hypothetical protein